MALIGGGARGVFDGCRFEGNEAWGGAPSPTYAYDANVGEGGAVYARGGAASFRRCEFVGNVAEKEGGAVYVDGGGTATFEACTFARNRVHDDYWDGGAGVFLASPKTFARFGVVRFEDNAVAGVSGREAARDDVRRGRRLRRARRVRVVHVRALRKERGAARRGGVRARRRREIRGRGVPIEPSRASVVRTSAGGRRRVRAVFRVGLHREREHERTNRRRRHARPTHRGARQVRLSTRRGGEGNVRGNRRSTTRVPPPPPGAFAEPKDDDDDDDKTYSLVDAATSEATVEAMGVDFAAAFAEGGVRSVGEESANPNVDRDDDGGSF